MASLYTSQGKGWKQVWQLVSADVHSSGGGGPRTSLLSLLAHPPVTILIVTAGVAAANLTWLDPVSPCTVHRRAMTPLRLHHQFISRCSAAAEALCPSLAQVLGPRCEATGFSVPGIGLLFGFQSAVYAVSSPLAGWGRHCCDVCIL